MDQNRLPRAYYNENDSFSATWLQELIKAGLIADGDVDNRSIEDVQPNDLRAYTQCHFFAGIGVWSYALRQSNWPDNRTVWTGSCPCQPFSIAGKNQGIADERHLWPAWFYLINECRPNTIFGEQVASKGGLSWLDIVSSDLEGANYAVGSVDTCAAGFGAPHIRQRLYFVADSQCERLSRPLKDERISLTEKEAFSERIDEAFGTWRVLETNPTSLPNLDGTPLWLARKFLRGYGNALVAPQAQAFIEAYKEIVG